MGKAALTLWLLTVQLAGMAAWAAPSHATIDSNLVLVIDGRKVFPIGFTLPPPPEGKTPDGRNGLAELAAAGATFLRTGAGTWNAETVAKERQYLDVAARNGLFVMPYLGNRTSVDSTKKEEALRDLIGQLKDYPALGAWKGEDEPEWGKRPLEPLLRAREIIRKADPNHPVVIIQAPRGTVESMHPYNAAGDILGADIYPVSYPPGIHSLLPNREISLVGDHTRIMMDVAKGKQPVWMVLQIAWSGVVKPGKTLRFPTFAEERFMTYEAIINGARGVVYFGGNLEQAMSAADKALGWNWTFWRRVLRPVVEEIGTHSPLYPALLAADSAAQIKAAGADGIEVRAREVGGDLFLLACTREGKTANVEFSGLPLFAAQGEVLFEAPRTVTAQDGRFEDWFGPFEVHVYRFAR